MWSAAKEVFRGKFIGVNACIRKEERTKFNFQASIIGNQKKKSKLKPKEPEKKEIRIRAKINEIEKQEINRETRGNQKLLF